MMIDMVRPTADRLSRSDDAKALLDHTISFLNMKLEMGFTRSELEVQLVSGEDMYHGGYGYCETHTSTTSRGVVTHKGVINIKKGLAADYAVVVMTHELMHYWMNTKGIAPHMLHNRTNIKMLDEVMCELMGALAAQAMRWESMKDSQVKAAKSYANRFGAQDAVKLLVSHIDTVVSKHSGIVAALLPIYLSAMNL